MNPVRSPFNNAAIRSYLGTFDQGSAKRGRAYFRSGAVISLTCVEPDRHFVAHVRGSEVYEVHLECFEDEWDGQCTCPLVCDCKHIFAAMLHLQQQGAAVPDSNTNGPSRSTGSPGRLHEFLSPPASPKPNPAKSDSPLVQQVISALGRKPNGLEQTYLRSVQNLFRTIQHQRRLPMTNDLRVLAPTLNDYGWTTLELWPAAPANDLEFWLYCAWELRRRGLNLPPFLEKASDFNLIAPRMQAWERSKEITRWHEVLAASSTAALKNGEVTELELRLVLKSDHAIIEWRPSSGEPFKELKQGHARRFMQVYEANALELSPTNALLWQSFYKSYDYYTWTNLSYSLPETLRRLSQVLRLPALAEQVVRENGQPVVRPTEPLHYALEAASHDTDDYKVRLVRQDGSAVGPILATFPGRPTLYLTAEALHIGPPSHGLNEGAELVIPAPAMESATGVVFLGKLDLPLPPRLVERTRRVAVQVKILCDLQPTSTGAAAEAVRVRVHAQAEGEELEQFSVTGWNPEKLSYRSRTVRSNGATSDGLIPVIDRTAQHHFPRLLEALGAKWDSYQQSWRVRLGKQFPETFVAWLAGLPAGVEVLLDRDLATLRDAPVSGSVRLDLTEAGVDWFDLKVVLNLSETELTPDEIKMLLDARGRFVRLGAKGWRRLQFHLDDDEDERLARLGLDARDFSAEPQRLHALQLTDEAARKLLPEQQVEQIRRRVEELKARVNPPVPEAIRAELRPYQLEGFHFLAYLTANRFGGVLADDMGLGKTLQTLTWLAWLRNDASVPPASGRKKKPSARKKNPSTPEELNSRTDDGSPLLPSLVVCPKSVMDNWRAEAARFLPGLRVRIWRGEDAEALVEARTQEQLIVINYSQMRALSPAIAQMNWHTAILDEAQYIKNPDSQTAQVARSLKAEHRLALTGTPIENRLLDLWSIVAYAMPGVLNNRAQFLKRFNAVDDPLARKRLAARVRPFLLRRTKNQVAKDLPDRVEEDLLCELEGEQKTLYRAEFKRAQQLLLKVKTKQDLNENRFNFLTSLLRLRQICCHPALVNESLRQAESAKVNALVDLLEPLMEEGHKVLVFSQFVTMLDLLRDTVKARDWRHFYLAGATEDRGELVEAFQKTDGPAVFLISLKAGGFGLNLTAASYVVLFDPWWNPAVESQAIDRTHRIGQTSKVMAYRLLMKDSIEEKIRALQKNKAALAEDVLGEETFARSLTLEDLKFLFAEE